MVEVARAAVAACLLMPGIALAELAVCPEISSDSDSFKVVLDQLSVPAPVIATAPTPAEAALVKLKVLLEISLNFQLQEIKKEIDLNKYTPAIDLGLVNCLNRKPSLGGVEFTPAHIDLLNDQRVVVELWGTLLASDDSAGGPRATIGYIIPPVLIYRSEPAVPGRYLIQYPNGSLSASEALQKLPEASAFALLGLAVKARKALKYDLAVWAFERSTSSLTTALKLSGHAPPDAAGDPGLIRLLAYARLAACETRNAARANSQYLGSIAVTEKETCKVSP